MKMMQQAGSNCAIAGSSLCNAIASSPTEINGNCTAETFLTAEDRR